MTRLLEKNLDAIHAQELEHSLIQGFPPAIPKCGQSPLATSKLICLSLNVIMILSFSMSPGVQKLGKNFLRF